MSHHIRRVPCKWSRLALAAIVFAAIPPARVQAGQGGQALAQSRPTSPDFDMAAQEGPFRALAEEFMAAAAAGNLAKTTGMLSPTAAARAGDPSDDYRLCKRTTTTLARLTSCLPGTKKSSGIPIHRLPAPRSPS